MNIITGLYSAQNYHFDDFSTNSYQEYRERRAPTACLWLLLRQYTTNKPPPAALLNSNSLFYHILSFNDRWLGVCGLIHLIGCWYWGLFPFVCGLCPVLWTNLQKSDKCQFCPSANFVRRVAKSHFTSPKRFKNQSKRGRKLPASLIATLLLLHLHNHSSKIQRQHDARRKEA